MSYTKYGVMKAPHVKAVYDVLTESGTYITFRDLQRALPDLTYSEVRSALMRLYYAGYVAKVGRTPNGKTLWRVS